MRARDNPYTVQRVHRLRYRLSEQDWQLLFARWEELGFRGALVGAHGHGKSTLLAEFGRRSELLGWRLHRGFLRQGDRVLSDALEAELLEDLGPRDLILLDGAEQLTRWSWHSLRRRSRAAGGLLITSHRAGLLPTLRRCETTPELLADLMQELHEDCGCDQPSAHELFDRFAGDVRLALRELYDVHALRSSPLSDRIPS